MRQSNQEINSYGQGEIDLTQIVRSLINYKWFILGFTGFVTLIATLYMLSLPPLFIEYKAKNSFLKPTESSVLQLNKSYFMSETVKNAFVLNAFRNAQNLEMQKALINDSADKSYFMSETKETVHASFLNKLNNKELQRNVFIEGDYIAKLNTENEPIDDVEGYISQFISSISLAPPDDDNISKTDALKVVNKAYSISIQGTNPKILAEYLNDFVHQADTETVADFINLIRKKIFLRLDEIAMEREMLLAKARQERLNDVIVLSNAAKIAKSLGIIENNFSQISGEDNVLSIAISEDRDFPNWYLYGEKALLEGVKLLKQRENDAPYIPKIVILDIERNELETAIKEASTKGISSMQSLRSSIVALPMSSRNQLIVGIALFAGLMMSSLSVLLMEKLRLEEKPLLK